ncbi:MAG: hypothetical protein ABI036_10705 [Fibrobacteria bacterium]
MNRNKILLGGLLGGLIGSALLLSLHPLFRKHGTRGAGFDTLSNRPWRNIGGCGAGGSGGGSSGVRWIGRGVSGALLDVEFMPKINFGQTFLNGMAEPRLGYHPRWSTELGLSMPIGMKEMEVQYQSNLDQQLIRNGSRGDLTADIRQSFGDHSQYAAQFALTFPTGQYDARRGTDRSKNILPQGLQMGRGIYSGTLGLSYTRDNDQGMMVFDGYYTYPFMIRLDGKNEYLETEYRDYASTAGKTRSRFRYGSWLKPYGESDRGDYYPPSASIDAIYARRTEGTVQSFQVFFSAPMGVRWIHSPDPALYDPMPDPDNRAWDLAFGYGLESSSETVPLFFGVGMPMHAKRDISGAWTSPDWENVGQEWIFALGFKAILF